MIYADNAATTQLDIDAFNAMKPYLLDFYGNGSQPYSFSRQSRQALVKARETIAACIGAKAEEIYFTSGGTESDNWVIKGFGNGAAKRQIITSVIEHHAVLNACQHTNADVVYLPVDAKGVVSVTDLQQKLANGNNDNVAKLVSVMLVNNEIGTIEPIKELAAVAHKQGALFHTDAVQAVGHIPINVEDLGIDFLSASGHKFNGPKGIGFLYIKQGTLLGVYADGGAQERGMRAGTENVAAIVAMATALQKNCEQMATIEAKLKAVDDVFLHTLAQAGVDFIINGARGVQKRVPGNINISIKGEQGERLLHRLDLMHICVSTGSACDSVNTQLSHVIKAIKVPKEYAYGTLRISFGRDNTISDAANIAFGIAEIVSN